MNDRSAPTGHKSHTIVTALAVALRHQSDCKRGPKLDSVTASLMAQLGLDWPRRRLCSLGSRRLGVTSAPASKAATHSPRKMRRCARRAQ